MTSKGSRTRIRLQYGCEEGSPGVAGIAGRLTEAPKPGQSYNLGVKKVVKESLEDQQEFQWLQDQDGRMRLQTGCEEGTTGIAGRAGRLLEAPIPGQG